MNAIIATAEGMWLMLSAPQDLPGLAASVMLNFLLICAQYLVPMDMVFQGMSMSLFEAKEQWSKMSS
jgi:hypothetical protein